MLKVDRSFVDGLGTEPEDSAVVAAILSLAHALGLHVVAEGVETPLQANQLIALGCPVAQGFLWSPAVPAGELPGLAELGTAAHPRVRGHRGERQLVDEMMHQIGIAKEGLAMTVVARHPRARSPGSPTRRWASITGYELHAPPAQPRLLALRRWRSW